jgi:hypothetical protein
MCDEKKKKHTSIQLAEKMVYLHSWSHSRNQYRKAGYHAFGPMPSLSMTRCTAPVQQLLQHTVETPFHVVEALVVGFEAFDDGMFGPGRLDSRRVMDDHEQISDVGVIFQVGAQTCVTPFGGLPGMHRGCRSGVFLVSARIFWKVD